MSIFDALAANMGRNSARVLPSVNNFFNNTGNTLQAALFGPSSPASSKLEESAAAEPSLPLQELQTQRALAPATTREATQQIPENAAEVKTSSPEARTTGTDGATKDAAPMSVNWPEGQQGAGEQDKTLKEETPKSQGKTAETSDAALKTPASPSSAARGVSAGVSVPSNALHVFNRGNISVIYA